MNLAELLSYFQENHFASMEDLHHHFEKDPDIIRDQLAHWIEEGSIRPIKPFCGQGCPHCNCLSELSLELYELAECHPGHEQNE